MKSKLGFILILILTLGLAGCAAGQSSAADCESRFDRPADVTNRCDMEVSAGARTATLKAHFALQSGTADVTLRDPEGTAVWEQQVQAGTPVDLIPTLPTPGEGRWQLVIETIGAVGEYHADWETN